MRKQKLFHLALLLSGGLVLSSCSGDNPAAGTTTPPSSQSQNPALPTGGAPAVPAPLKTAAIESDPCSPVTEAQVTGLGLPQKSATVNSDAFGPGCSWRFDSERPSSFTTGLILNDPSHSGISGVYLQQRDGALTKFQAFTTAGYPGATYDNTTVPDPGHCVLSVGLRDDLAYTISVSLSSEKTPLGDPCELGKKVAGFVIEYLKKGQN